MSGAVVFAGLIFVLSIAVFGGIEALHERNQRIHRIKTLVQQTSIPLMQAKANSEVPSGSAPTPQTMQLLLKLTKTFDELLVQSGLSVSRKILSLAFFALVLLLTSGAVTLVPTDYNGALRLAVASVPATALATVVCVMILKSLQTRRIKRFKDRLPGALEIISRSLRAGRTTADAVLLVARDGNDLLAQEFRRCRSDIEHGAPLTAAIKALAERSGVPDMHFIASAISLQSVSGGNLAETLESCTLSLRQNRQVESKARALTAEVRTSALILTSLPLLVCCSLLIMNPSYLAPLVQDGRGRVMLGYAAGSLILGLLVMKRLEKVNV